MPSESSSENCGHNVKFCKARSRSSVKYRLPICPIERGRRNPPANRVILAWARILDPSGADEIGNSLIELAARDRNRAETVTEGVVEEVSRPWEASTPRRNRSDHRVGSDTPFLDYFQIDLVQHARNRSPAPGRERELLDITCGLSRRRRNSVVITGETSARHSSGSRWACIR